MALSLHRPEVSRGMLLDEANQGLVGHSARLRQVLRLSDKLGKGNWPVLILGETGTGKELVARTIHAASDGGPFIPIDCSSMVGPLMESELFGYAKGAFTGANANKMGLIEAADGGTAFFDEIGELPLDLQSKLLRVLQEKEFRPVGSLQLRRSSFRVIAATNRDLAAEVDKGTFRRDLYYRLNVVTLRLAPLRDRKDDIPTLVTHFLRRYGRGQTLSAEVLELILSYDWPGNVRELENCIQHMVAVNSGPIIHTGDLPSSLSHYSLARRGNTVSIAAAAAAPSGRLSYPTEPNGHTAGPSGPIIPLVEMEKRAIRDALLFTKGDRMAAAQMLGIGRTTLYRKLKEYALED